MDITITSVLGQLINFWILFFIFKKFLTKPIISAIEDRRSLIKKLESADTAYEEKVLEAKAEADWLIQEGLRKKEKLIAEAGILANKRRDEIIAEARNKAESIVVEAKSKWKNLESELQNNFSVGVKRTSLLVIKKLFQKDVNLQTAYLDEVINEVTK